MSLNNLVQSMKGGVQNAAKPAPNTLKPATPTAQGLGKLMMEMKNRMPQPTAPQPVGVGRPNARQGIRPMASRSRELRSRSPQMSPEMRQQMMGGRGAAV